ncbi:MAG: hypothetical protein ACLFOZ_20350, partial [Cyclobacteriaceae bacterium]
WKKDIFFMKLIEEMMGLGKGKNQAECRKLQRKGGGKLHFNFKKSAVLILQREGGCVSIGK